MLDHGHHHGHDHHVPTVYRMNSPGQVSGHLREAGFASVDFSMFDKPEMYAWYLPQPAESRGRAPGPPRCTAWAPLPDGPPGLPCVRERRRDDAGAG